MELRALAAIAASLVVLPAAFAQTDEIQVYDGAIADKGVFNLTWHNNFTPVGAKTPAFPGGLANNRNLNGVTEWAWGVTDWFEAGLYLPLYSVSDARGPTVNGGKIRLLFAVPHADDRKFVYAANFEFSYNSKHWDERRYTSEIRPIIGWHLHPIDIIVNPILDNSWAGGFKSLDFAPATRVAYNLSPKWAVALEEYADYGPLRDFYTAREQSHQIYGVFDHDAKFMHIEAGIGIGLTSSSDKVTLKLLLSRDLNSRPTK
jgi:opacity protein-like surface antigen